MKKNLIITFLAIFTYVISMAQPVITSFSPSSGTIGSTVNITGTGFNITLNQNIVFFGATKANVTSANSTNLTVTVPLGATYQNISVTNLGFGLTAYTQKPFVVTTPGNITFSPKIDFTVGVNPIAINTGDIDGDGKPDLVTTNYTSDDISILRNTSTNNNVSFDAGIIMYTGSDPYSVILKDIDNDGKLDLIVANRTSNNVSLFRNLSSIGTISFDSKIDISMGSSIPQPYSVNIEDLDLDGKSDLIVTIVNTNNISIFRNISNIGTISFDLRYDLASGGLNPNSISIGDIDNDSKPDLAVVNSTSNIISIFHNTSISGNISFSTKVDFATGSNPKSLSIGDIDNDGKLDLAVANYGNNFISVLRNTSFSTISFASKVDFPTGTSNPFSIKISDIDGDNKPDLVTTSFISNDSVSIFKNISTIGSILFSSKIDLLTNYNPQSLTIVDIDGDGKLDLSVVNYGTTTNQGSISVILQSTPTPVTTSFTPSSGCTNTFVTITGNNFNGTTSVSIGGTNVNFIVDSPTQITATIGNKTGIISVTTPGGISNSSTNFIANTLPNVSLSLTSNSISVNEIGAAYQWLNCDNSTLSSLTTTNQILDYKNNGKFKVIVTKNGCSDTSDCTSIETNLIENTKSNLEIYPNPGNEVINVKNITVIPSTITFLNLLGQEVLTQDIKYDNQIIDVSQLNKGIYIYIITNSKNENSKGKWVKNEIN